MKKSIAITSGLVFIALLAGQAWSQAYFYMLIDEGNEKWYDDVLLPGHQAHAYPDGEENGWTLLREIAYQDGIEIINYRWRISVDEDGNVWTFGVVGAIGPEVPILYVKAPLYVGSAWEQLVNWPGYGEIQSYHLCEAEEEIEVPFGTFTCFKVRAEAHHPDESIRVVNTWYCDGVGRVKEEHLYLGYTFVMTRGVIAVENVTWGAVKSLYR